MIKDIAIKRFVPIEQVEEEKEYQKRCLQQTLWDEGCDMSLLNQAEVTISEPIQGVMVETRIKNVEIPTLF